MGYVEVACYQSSFAIMNISFSDLQHHISWPSISLGTSGRNVSTILRIEHLPADQNQRGLIVTAYGAPSLVNKHSAACLGNTLAFVAGSYAVCVSSSLEAVLWWQQCDVGSCFGLYVVEQGNALIVHGELAITKLSNEGKILWQAEGRDIFINPPQIEGDEVKVWDTNDTEYCIQIDTGIIRTMSPGMGR